MHNFCKQGGQMMELWWRPRSVIIAIIILTVDTDLEKVFLLFFPARLEMTIQSSANVTPQKPQLQDSKETTRLSPTQCHQGFQRPRSLRDCLISHTVHDAPNELETQFLTNVKQDG